MLARSNKGATPASLQQQSSRISVPASLYRKSLLIVLGCSVDCYSCGAVEEVLIRLLKFPRGGAMLVQAINVYSGSSMQVLGWHWTSKSAQARLS